MKRPWYNFLMFVHRSSRSGSNWCAAVDDRPAALLGVVEESRMEAQTANWDGRAVEKGAEIYAQ
jgi:hypothetical protein